MAHETRRVRHSRAALAALVLSLCCARVARALDINFTEALWIPPYDYTEFVKSQVRMVLESFKPGKVLVTLNLTQSQPEYFDVFRFANCSVAPYLCYVKAMEFQQYQACQTNSSVDNSQCFDCAAPECIAQLNNQNLFDPKNASSPSMWCCLNCTGLQLQLITGGDGDAPSYAEIGQIPQGSEIFIIDNSPFPDGSAGVGNSSLNFTARYSVQMEPNNNYYVWTLALAIILAIVLMLLSSCLCILIYKYKKAKSHSQTMNLVTGDESVSAFDKQSQVNNKNAQKQKKSKKVQ